MTQTTNSPTKRTHVTVFFTWDVSLKIWHDKGLFAREFRLYEELHKRGIDFTFVTWGDASDLGMTKDYTQFNFIPLYTLIPYSRFKPIRALISLIAPFKLRTQLKNTDIIKTNQMWGAWVAVLSKWLTRKPLILRSGYELYDFTVKSGASKLRQNFIKLISLIAYKNADQIFVATNYDKEIVRHNFKVTKTPITLRPNWIDTTVFKPLECRNIKDRLLFVGRLSPQKNLKMLIDACAAENIGLDIYGGGEMREELEKYAQSKKADIIFQGAVANDKLPQIYNAYRAYILCSHYEGNPKTLLEAMSCGMLCIGTNVDGIKNLLNHEKTGLICEKTTDALRDSISHAMNSNRNFDSIKHAASQLIAESYSLNSAINHELKSYETLIKK